MYFLFTTSGKFSNFAAKTAKRKPDSASILRKETTEKTKSNMDEDEFHSQSEFYYPEDLETSETGISESQEDFINRQKSENTEKKRRLLV